MATTGSASNINDVLNALKQKNNAIEQAQQVSIRVQNINQDVEGDDPYAPADTGGNRSADTPTRNR